jgi:AcrR family transcriptional regulator
MIIKQSDLCEIVDASGLFEAGLEGVSEARQARSKATVAKLISTGHAMLNDRSLDDLSIEDLCGAADCTIGAFYSRFESKEAYFAAVQFVVCADRDRALAAVVAEAKKEEWSLQRICAALVDDLTQWYRANHGVLRASLMHARNGQSSWSSIKELGARHKGRLGGAAQPPPPQGASSERAQAPCAVCQSGDERHVDPHAADRPRPRHAA